MQSLALQSLPPKVHRSLAKLGGEIATARRKRSLTVMMMAERIGSAKTTYAVKRIVDAYQLRSYI